MATDAEVPGTEAEALATEVPGSRDTGSQRNWQLILAAETLATEVLAARDTGN